MYFYRKICRWYSEKFHTPLHQVLEGSVVSWDEIMQHYYESSIENLSYNEAFDMAITEYLPEFANEFEESNEAFAKALIEEQKRTIELNKKKAEEKAKKAEKKAEKNDKPPQKDIPAPPPPMNLKFDDEDL